MPDTRDFEPEENGTKTHSFALSSLFFHCAPKKTVSQSDVKIVLAASFLVIVVSNAFHANIFAWLKFYRATSEENVCTTETMFVDVTAGKMLAEN